MRAAACGVLALAATATPAEAQARKGSWELGAGAVWLGGVNVGDTTATLERPGGGTFELFRAETEIGSAFGPAVTLSFHPWQRVAFEAGFSYSRPRISTRVTNDAEGAPPVTASVGTNQYIVEGSLRWYLKRRISGMQPFLKAGGAFIRQLDEDNAHVENGQAFQAGAGVDRLFRERARGRVKRIGLRADARVSLRSGGFDIADKMRVRFGAGALLFLGF